MQTHSLDHTMHSLSDHELDAVSGGFVYIAVVVGAFAVGTGISTGAVTGDVIGMAKKYAEQKKGTAK